jgi:hypothetical protein
VQSATLFPYANELSSEYPYFLIGLLGHGGVALCALRRLEDKVPGLLLGHLKPLDIAIQLADVLSYEGIAFALLLGVRGTLETHVALRVPALQAWASIEDHG